MRRSLIVASMVGAAAVALWFCTQAPALQHYSGDALVLDHWELLGPFVADAEEDPMARNFLSAAKPELQAFESRAGGVAARVTRCLPTAWRQAGWQLRAVEAEMIDFQNIYGRSYNPELPPSAVYAGTELVCTSDTAAQLMIGSADSVRIWINGEIAFENNVRRGLACYNDTIPIKLQRGTNRIVVKVARWRGGWGLTARLEPSAAAATLTSLRMEGLCNSRLLAQKIVPRAADLQLFAKRLAPLIGQIQLSILDGAGRPVDQRIDLAALPMIRTETPLTPGAYCLVLTCADGQSYQEAFCIGDPQELRVAWLKKAEQFASDDTAALSVRGLSRRLEILYRPENRPQAPNVDWDIRVVFALSEMSALVATLEKKQGAFDAQPGIHVVGFRSAIDGSAQYYRCFTPSGAPPPAGRPCAIFLPTVVSAARPFLESAFIAAHQEAEKVGRLADRYGVAVLWPGYRSQPTGGPADFVHMDEAMRAYFSRAQIDPRRVVLIAACGGAAIGELAATRWPGRFAGLGMLNPVFTLAKNPTAQAGEYFSQAEGYGRWEHENDVTEKFLQTKSCPVFLLHDGAEPGHGSLEISRGFVAAAQKAGYPLVFLQSDQPLAQHFDAWNRLLAWAAQQQRTTPPAMESASPHSKPQPIGSVEQFLAEPFVLVTPSGGSAQVRAAQAGLTEDFQRAWEESNFGRCIQYTDTDVPADVLRSLNLVLIGDETTNRVIRNLGLRLHDVSEVALGSKRWPGAGVTVQAVLRNPAVAERKILVIGGNSPEAPAVGRVSLPRDGWFSYAAWQNDGGAPRLIEAGTW